MMGVLALLTSSPVEVVDCEEEEESGSCRKLRNLERN